MASVLLYSCTSLEPDPSCTCTGQFLDGIELCGECTTDYPIALSSVVIGLALVAAFLFFLLPASAHLTIKYYLRHSLADSYARGEVKDTCDAVDIPQPPRAYLTATRLSYSVPMNEEMREKTGSPKNTDIQLLNDISLCFPPGTLTAIMGPSGCGKSTLLNCLADRQPPGKLEGEVSINGFERDKYFKRASAYVMQFDKLLPYLTVRETLQYTAEFRLDVPDKDKIHRVEAVIRQLDLESAADTLIGDDLNPALKGISGGQRRRVTVGIELLTAPAVLFLDEPTTGLDAFDSLTLVKILRELAGTCSTTVICTIHQPRCDIFDLFDTLLLMVKGEVAYFGKIENIPIYFAEAGQPIPEDANVADYIVDLTYSRGDDEGQSTAQSLVETYASSELRKQNYSLLAKVMSRTLPDLPDNIAIFFRERRLEMDSRLSIKPLITSEAYANPIRRQVLSLARRSQTNSSRHRTALIQLLIAAGQFLFFGLLFLGIQTEELPDFVKGESVAVENRSKAGFMYIVINTACLIQVDVIAEAYTEKEVFFREHASGAYSVLAYHIFWLCKLGWRSVRNGVIYAILSYFLSGLTISVWQFLTYMLILCILCTIGAALALILVMGVPDVRGAGDIHSIIVGFMGTFAGFFLLPSLIPDFLKYYTYYLSFYRYAYEAMLWNEFNYGPDYTTAALTLRDLFNVDCNLDQWGNILVLLVYPAVFHVVAALLTFFFTRPSSFWDKKKKNADASEGHKETKTDNWPEALSPGPSSSLLSP